jgi:hypothetical protein
MDQQPPAFVVCNFHPQITQRALNAALDPPDPEMKPRVCYKRGKNLTDKLVKARLPGFGQPEKGKQDIRLTTGLGLSGRLSSTASRKPNCLCCQQMSALETVFSSGNHTSHRVPPNTTCNTNQVVYHLHCTKCTSRSQYIGQTKRTLRDRVAGHRAAFEGNKSMPLYRHFRRRDHDFSMVPNISELPSREKHWIRTLNNMA